MGWKPLDIKHALVRARKNSNFEPQLWSKESYYFWTKTCSTLVRHKLHMAQTFTTLKSSLITSTNPPLILIIASEIDQWNRLRFVSQFLVFTKYSRKRFFPPEQVSRYVLCTDRYQITSDFSLTRDHVAMLNLTVSLMNLIRRFIRSRHRTSES